MPEEKQKVARPRDPQTGRFIIFDNEQEKHVKALEERLENQRIDALQLSEEMAALRDERDALKTKVESQLDTIRGDRKQINTLKAEIDALQGVNGNLAHDRDAMTAEVDRLTGLLTEALRAQETALGQEEIYRARWTQEQKRCRFVQIAGYLCITLGCFGTYLACTFFGGAK